MDLFDTTPLLPDIPWSISALHDAETCLLQHYLCRIAKTHGQTKGKAQYAGDEVHTAMKEYVERGTQPPLGCRKLKEIVDKLSADATDIVVEAKQGIRRDLTLCDYFAPDVNCRIIIDFMALHNDVAFVVDYKTGSLPRDTPDQLRVNSWLVFARYPQVRRVYAMFAYTKFDNKGYVFDRKDLPDSVSQILPRVAWLKHAHDTKQFPPQPCWKCKKFCPVTECRYHGK